MNPLDIAALVVLALSAAFGLQRGFVREVLGLAAWVGAAFGTVWLFPVVDPPLRGLVGDRQVGDALAYALGFLLLLVVFSIVAEIGARAVRATPLGDIDRVLGLGFGVVRGAAILVAAYVLAGLVAPPGSWPDAVRRARATPLAYDGAAWAAGLVPQSVRPHVEPPDAVGPHMAGGRLQPASFVPQPAAR